MTTAPIAKAWLPWAAFTAVSLIWGSTWLAHKWALADLTPTGLLIVRLAIAAPLCLFIGLMRGEAWPARAHLPALLIAGFVLTGACNVATSWSLGYLPSGVGAILQAPIPVWMALLALRTDPLSKAGWLAVLLGLCGVCAVMWPSERVHLPVFASVVCVLAAVAWAYASLFQRARVHSGGLFINAGIQMTQGALLGLLTFAFGMPISTHGEIGLDAMLAVLYLAVFGSCIAFASYIYLTQVWHPARATSFSYLNPVVAVLLGVWLGSEVLTQQMIFGLGLILASVLTLQVAAGRGR
jgi:drug/metabolite transporter (DMT)-like permease